MVSLGCVALRACVSCSIVVAVVLGCQSSGSSQASDPSTKGSDEACFRGPPAGACNLGDPHCSPYRCIGGICAACSSGHDCQEGHACANGLCVPLGRCGTCIDDSDCKRGKCDLATHACQ